ncbi:MAG: Xaa-Pro peptidase family protein [Clostridiales bacterium]|jgi:Xaa-Pro aminopeptidase|nr:Xaa-Pro peptidase family protein [Clostridiales bacterium]
MDAAKFDNLFESLDALLLFSETNRFYFTGFRTSYGCVIVGRNTRVLITDGRYEADARKYAQGFEVVTAAGNELFEAADKILKGMGAKKVGYEDEFVTVAAFKAVKAACKEYKLIPASADIYAKRIVKTDDEIALIAEAEAITYRAIHKVLPYIKPGVTEKEISDHLTYAMLSGGAEALAFPNIVCFGVNTAVPHHSPSPAKRLEKNELVLLDIGARFNGYAGDMTRTFSVGTVSDKLQRIHKIVLSAQAYALEKLKAGMTCHEADAYAREYIVANGYGEEFTHSLGHGVGIEVHEAPRLNRNADTVLKENMVVSVEPGIYVGGLGGVRIEDLVVIKEGGIVNLTNFNKNINL